MKQSIVLLLCLATFCVVQAIPRTNKKEGFNDKENEVETTTKKDTEYEDENADELSTKEVANDKNSHELSADPLRVVCRKYCVVRSRCKRVCVRKYQVCAYYKRHCYRYCKRRRNGRCTRYHPRCRTYCARYRSVYGDEPDDYNKQKERQS